MSTLDRGQQHNNKCKHVRCVVFIVERATKIMGVRTEAAFSDRDSIVEKANSTCINLQRVSLHTEIEM